MEKKSLEGSGGPSCTLDQLSRGKVGIIIRMENEVMRRKKLADLGLIQGVPVEMRGRSPFGNLLLLKVMGGLFSLARSDAAKIHVYVLPSDRLK